MQITILISALAAFSWLVVVGFLALAVLRARQGKKTRGSVTGIIVAVIAGLLLSTVSAGLVFVQPQERGVVISALAEGGYRKDILQPGLRWVIPYAENVKTYPISKSTYTMSIAQLEGEIQGDDSIAARTADGQEVYIDASIIFSLNPAEVLNVHIVWQDRYLDGLIRPTVRGVIRDAVSQFRVNEVYSTKRDQLKMEIEDVMRIAMEDNGLILSDFVLRNITFTTEYAASIEQKQIAQQQAEQMRFVLEKSQKEAERKKIEAEGVKEAAIVEAQGEAEALRLINEQITQNENLLIYRYIEKLSPNIRVMIVPSNNPFILNLEDLRGQVETPKTP